MWPWKSEILHEGGMVYQSVQLEPCVYIDYHIDIMYDVILPEHSRMQFV